MQTLDSVWERAKRARRAAYWFWRTMAMVRDPLGRRCLARRALAAR